MSFKINYIKIKKFLVNLVGMFVAGQFRRDQFRLHFFLPKICFSHDVLPIKKYDRKINVSFCFDNGMCKHAAIAIESLLDVSKNRCDYNIYCVVDDSVSDDGKKLLKKIAANHGSALTFLTASHDFDKSWLGKWPISIYYRLMLPGLLPHLDEIIYADTDVVFCSDLIEADQIEMGRNLIGAVRDTVDGTINSGFLKMNLAQIRNECTDKKWIKTSQTEHFLNPDQDLLNYTCKDRILYLPLKYNFIARPCFRNGDKSVYSELEYHELKYHLVMMHYASDWKPWSDNQPPFSDIWWKYAKKTEPFNT